MSGPYYTGWRVESPDAREGAPVVVHILTHGTASECDAYWTRRAAWQREPSLIEYRITLVDLEALATADEQVLDAAIQTDPALHAIAHRILARATAEGRASERDPV